MTSSPLRGLLHAAALAAVLALTAPACREDQQTSADWASEWGRDDRDQAFKCHDDLDNDQDGLTDCSDHDCAAVCAEGDPANLDTCRDGLDNDSDGRSDCDDDGCVANEGCCPPEGERSFEGSTLESCRDMLDNDCNGYLDCDDKRCYESEDIDFCENTDDDCADGLDNEGDGYTDCEDWSCANNDKVTICD